MNGFKYMVDRASLLKLTPGQHIYHQYQPTTYSLYLIVHGSFIFTTQQAGNFGSIMCIGHTLGEEIMFQNEHSIRSESAIAND